MTSPPPATALDDARSACTNLLPRVSRTFALTIPVLEEPLRSYVGVAYLLCRVADTIEDRPRQTRVDRDRRLRRFAEVVRDAEQRLDSGELGGDGTDPEGAAPYESLVASAGGVVALYREFPEPVRDAVATCVEDMVDGMTEFPAPTGAGPAVAACADLEDLERYCHAVAGTVGLLLSELFAHELGGNWLEPGRADQGRRFGLGLQLTNVLKDREGDDRRGITYIPPAWLSPEGGLTPGGRSTLIRQAVLHLDEAQRFIVSIPASHAEKRLFCLWAAHLALATLGLAADGDEGPTKVSRDELGRILATTRAHVADDENLEALYREGREAVFTALASR
jgi:farnesyl-diphosphate farnesyltransferase